MKIAWITYDFEEYSVLHANALSKDHEVLLVMGIDDDVELPPISSSVHQHLFQKPRLRQPFRQYRSISNILQRIKQFDPDVVHVQQGHFWFNLALRFLKTPIVITIHDPRHHAGDAASSKTPQWLVDYGFRKADHVILHGEALSTQVQSIFGFHEDQVHVVPHVAMGKTIGNEIPEDPNMVLFFGRIWDYKGLDNLIAAQPLITRECPEAKIVIAGEGEDFAKYEAMMVNRDRFDVHNSWISDDDRARFFQQSALVVLPYNEATQSGVVPVAYNYNRPVVATNVGALAECVIDESTGLLVPPRDPEKLAAAIVRLLQNKSERHAMGEAGKAYLDAQCSPAVVAKRTADVYRKAVGDDDTKPMEPVHLNGKEESSCETRESMLSIAERRLA